MPAKIWGLAAGFVLQHGEAPKELLTKGEKMKKLKGKIEGNLAYSIDKKVKVRLPKELV